MAKQEFIVASLIWSQEKEDYVQPGEVYQPPKALKGEELDGHMEAMLASGAVVASSDYRPPEDTGEDEIDEGNEVNDD